MISYFFWWSIDPPNSFSAHIFQIYVKRCVCLFPIPLSHLSRITNHAHAHAQVHVWFYVYISECCAFTTRIDLCRAKTNLWCEVWESTTTTLPSWSQAETHRWKFVRCSERDCVAHVYRVGEAVWCVCVCDVFASGLEWLIGVGVGLGDIVYMNVLGNDLVIINSTRTANELFEKRSYLYADRPKMPVLQLWVVPAFRWIYSADILLSFFLSLFPCSKKHGLGL